MPLQLDDVIHTEAFAADPFPYYREIQENDPVQWSEAWNCWVVTRYEDVRTCLQDYRRFSNVGRVTGLFDTLFDREQLEALRPLIGHYSHGLINVDPPDHTRIRKLLHDVFKPATIGRLAGHVKGFVESLLTAARPAEGVAVVRELAHPLPVHVIAQLFGVPQADVGRFTRWSSGIVEFMKVPRPDFDTCLRSQQALLDLRQYLREAISEREMRPTDDVLSLMVRATSEGDSLSKEEILGTSVTLLLGGHETTTRLIANTVLELCRQPEQRGRLHAELELMETAVEECLRFCGPFHRDQRVALMDTEVNGRKICRGDYILMMLAAANRDPRAFPDPERFDLGRKPNRHLAFGFGPHVCLGAHLARLELGVTLRALLKAGPAWRLGPDPIEWEFGFLRGPRELVVEFQSAPGGASPARPDE